MSSRDKILATVKSNQPEAKELPPLDLPVLPDTTDAVQKFIAVLEAIGGSAYIVSGFDRIAVLVKEQFPDAHRIVSNCPELSALAEVPTRYDDPHLLENIDVAVLRAHFGVAENGACWITEDLLAERVIPFIAQHLALVINKKDIVRNMHEAYARIADAAYGFGVFIAGPSKTADIEQSLVLGAHGPRSMMVFLIDEGTSDAGFF